jgi:hypothetical protein
VLSKTCKNSYSEKVELQSWKRKQKASSWLCAPAEKDSLKTIFLEVSTTISPDRKNPLFY